ncbi:MAG: DUF4376 domain-containing protein [Gammaproteobacteria bacterium]|nr:DUF4376 domain-containing protein [Gammaproteobacteria bacterium]
MIQKNYMNLLSEKYPGVICISPDPSDYSSIIWESGDPLPSQSQLDSDWADLVVREKQKEINNYRDVFLDDGGFYFQGNVYDCDTLAKANITGAVTSVLVGTTLPADFSWRTLDNQNILMDGSTLSAFGVSMGAYVSMVFAWSWVLKTRIDSLSDVNAINNFNPANYWPNNNFDGSGPGGISTEQSIQAAQISLDTDYPL